MRDGFSSVYSVRHGSERKHNITKRISNEKIYHVRECKQRVYIICRANSERARARAHIFYCQLFFGLTTSSLGFIILYRLFKEENLSFRLS